MISSSITSNRWSNLAWSKYVHVSRRTNGSAVGKSKVRMSIYGTIMSRKFYVISFITSTCRNSTLLTLLFYPIFTYPIPSDASSYHLISFHPILFYLYYSLHRLCHFVSSRCFFTLSAFHQFQIISIHPIPSHSITRLRASSLTISLPLISLILL